MTERKEFKLWTDRKTREHYENLADLFAIIKTTDKLEKAWIRASSMPAKDYEDACSRLIAQFRTVKTALGWDTQRVEAFMKEYKMVCSNARLRLIESGVPATVEYGQPTTQDDGQRAKASAEAVHYFITAMDGLKLDLKAVDEIYPQLNDIVSTLNRVSGLPQDFPGKVTNPF